MAVRRELGIGFSCVVTRNGSAYVHVKTYSLRSFSRRGSEQLLCGVVS
jgi:hypothetical protein